MDDEKIINFGELKNKVRENDVDDLEKYVYDLYFQVSEGKLDMMTFAYKMYAYMNEHNISPEKFTQMQKKLLERYGVGEQQIRDELIYYSKHPEELKGFNISSQELERMAFEIGKDFNTEKSAPKEPEDKESAPSMDNVMDFNEIRKKNIKEEEKVEEAKSEEETVLEDLDYSKVYESEFYNKYSEALTYDSVMKYHLVSAANDIEIILDKERVNLISKGSINLVDIDLNDFLVAYKKMLNLKLTIVISENCNIYEY